MTKPGIWYGLWLTLIPEWFAGVGHHTERTPKSSKLQEYMARGWMKKKLFIVLKLWMKTYICPPVFSSYVSDMIRSANLPVVIFSHTFYTCYHTNPDRSPILKKYDLCSMYSVLDIIFRVEKKITPAQNKNVLKPKKIFKNLISP